MHARMWLRDGICPCLRSMENEKLRIVVFSARGGLWSPASHHGDLFCLGSQKARTAGAPEPESWPPSHPSVRPCLHPASMHACIRPPKKKKVHTPPTRASADSFRSGDGGLAHDLALPRDSRHPVMRLGGPRCDGGRRPLLASLRPRATMNIAPSPCPSPGSMRSPEREAAHGLLRNLDPCELASANTPASVEPARLIAAPALRRPTHGIARPAKPPTPARPGETNLDMLIWRRVWLQQRATARGSMEPCRATPRGALGPEQARINLNSTEQMMGVKPPSRNLICSSSAGT